MDLKVCVYPKDNLIFHEIILKNSVICLSCLFLTAHNVSIIMTKDILIKKTPFIQLFALFSPIGAYNDVIVMSCFFVIADYSKKLLKTGEEMKGRFIIYLS